MMFYSAFNFQSNPESLFATHYQNLLLPSHTYGFVSGGDPLVIPNLTVNDTAQSQ